MRMKSLEFRLYLVTQSGITLIMTVTGNIYMALFALRRKGAWRHPMKLLLFNLAISNLLAAILCMPFHISKVIATHWSLETLGKVSCLARYGLTFIFAPSSLLFLTLLCCFRRDQITKIPFGKDNSINQRNVQRLVLLSWLISLLPNLVFVSAYISLLLTNNVSPCQPNPDDQKTSLYYLGISESIKSSLLFGSCVTIIIRAVPKIRRILKGQTERIRQSGLQSVDIRKVNASFGFAGSFLLMWVPFGGIAVSSKLIPADLYDDFFNVGYTFATASFAVTPAIYACVDRHFRNFVGGGAVKITRVAARNSETTKPVALSVINSTKFGLR